jgi:hypothetical protein
MLQKNNFAFFKDFVTSGSYKPHARLGGNSPPSLPGGAPTKQKTRAHRISHRRAHPAHRRREGRKATMAIADQGSVLPTHADREGFSLSPTVHGRSFHLDICGLFDSGSVFRGELDALFNFFLLKPRAPRAPLSFARALAINLVSFLTAT